VGAGSSARLALRGSGLQTGAKWTENAVDLFMTSTYEPAVLTRLKLIEAVMRANGGKPVQLSEIARMLKAAPVGYIVLSHAKVTGLNAVIRGIARWRTVLKLYKVPLP
jgi:hypothetical protein